MGGILQDSINEMGAKAVLKGAVTRCRAPGSLGGSVNFHSERVETVKMISSSSAAHV